MMNQIFPLAHPASTTREKCWYCQAAAHPSAAIKVEMAKMQPTNYSLLDEKTNLTYPLFLVPIVFTSPWRLELFVPRCLGCRIKHGVFRVLKVILPIPLSLSLLYLYFLNLYLFTGFVIVMLIVYGLMTRVFHVEMKVPAFIKRQQYNYAFQHTEITHLCSAGWFVVPKKVKIKKKR